MNDNETYRVYTELNTLDGVDHVTVELTFPLKDLESKYGMNTIHNMYFDTMADIDSDISEQYESVTRSSEEREQPQK